MSEPEDDLVLLDEIRALEDVLAADESSESSAVNKDVTKRHNLAKTTRRANLQSRGFGEVTPYHQPNNLVKCIGKEEKCYQESALETNRKLIELLLESKRELMSMLEKCIENKAIVEEKVKERAKNAKSSKILIGSAGMPYFKDAKQYVAPRNTDAQEKTNNGELQVVHLRYTSPWTARDRNVLWRAIRQEASNAVLQKAQPDGGEAAQVPSCSAGNFSTARLNLPKNFKAMVGPIGTKEFDWMKIANIDFENRHTPEECRVMWNVFLHPDINRYRWTKEEDSDINKLSKKFRYQDWDTLAKELGTNRSGYQCFIRYNTNNQSISLKESAWTPAEDKRLRECVDKFKIGNYIPWGIVGKYMPGRSKMQSYYRWKYNAAPHLKKGRFTAEEDAALLEAVEQHGKNFTKISTYIIPQRSSVQLSDRYLTLMQKQRGFRNSWTVNDDGRLIKLYKKYGSDWSRIAEKFADKTRTQLRHRHRSILRQWSKGVSIYEIPRSNNEPDDTDCEEEIEIIRRQRAEKFHSTFYKEIMTVDLELVKHFQLVPPAAKPGRKQKYYKREELEDSTRKLYILLKTLNVDLAIPDEIDDRSLVEKDKQLLHFYRDYKKAQIDYTRDQFENLKDSRSFDETATNREIHYTPLCPGNCNKKTKFRFYDRIDYKHPENFNSQLKLTLEIETPSIVIDSIGQDKSEEFDAMRKILVMEKVFKPIVLRKIYVLGPEMCSKALTNNAAKNAPRASAKNSRQEENAKKTKKSRRGIKSNTWDSSISEGIIYSSNKTADCVEPNYHTLLGLHHILSTNESVEQPAPEETTMSDEGRKAMETLRKRMLQLFKYPIGLSHVLRPEVYVKKVRTLQMIDSDEFDSDTPDQLSPAKKKRRTNRKSESK